MRRENYQPLLAAATYLTVAIVVTFQIYQWREPARLQADAAIDLEIAVAAGEEIYAVHCAQCHAEDGTGLIGPALNSKPFLGNVSDDQLFSLTKSGVPGTGMPAWSQAFGGPFTDEEIRQVVAFIRSWEPGLEEVVVHDQPPDPSRGEEIFESICFVCHGNQGLGSDRAPALNDSTLLTSFDNDWFRETISQGRPSKGMPTWGTVLSPAQIEDLVALISLWREGGGRRSHRD